MKFIPQLPANGSYLFYRISNRLKTFTNSYRFYIINFLGRLLFNNYKQMVKQFAWPYWRGQSLLKRVIFSAWRIT